jgi:hypothetical protein
VHVTKALAPLVTLVSSKMVNMLLALHSLDTNSLCSDSLLDFQPYSNLDLFVNFFMSTFLCMFHLWVGGSSSMVFKHF